MILYTYPGPLVAEFKHCMCVVRDERQVVPISCKIHYKSKNSQSPELNWLFEYVNEYCLISDRFVVLMRTVFKGWMSTLGCWLGMEKNVMLIRMLDNSVHARQEGVVDGFCIIR